MVCYLGIFKNIDTIIIIMLATMYHNTTAVIDLLSLQLYEMIFNQFFYGLSLIIPKYSKERFYLVFNCSPKYEKIKRTHKSNGII